jgi:hypothetical protein
MCKMQSRRSLSTSQYMDMIDVVRTGRTKVNDKLHNLHDGDVLLPPNPNSPSTLEVIPIHDHVNRQVESDWHPGNCGMANELGVAKKSSGSMVVSVEESCSQTKSATRRGVSTRRQSYSVASS